jgi:hypothetical protein
MIRVAGPCGIELSSASRLFDKRLILLVKLDET